MYLVFFILFRYDYLKITNENNDNTTKYCGVKTGHTFVVTGNHAVLIFHTGSIEERKGFLLSFTAVPQGNFTIAIWIVALRFYGGMVVGSGGTPYSGLCNENPPERGAFLRQ